MTKIPKIWNCLQKYTQNKPCLCWRRSWTWEDSSVISIKQYQVACSIQCQWWLITRWRWLEEEGREDSVPVPTSDLDGFQNMDLLVGVEKVGPHPVFAVSKPHLVLLYNGYKIPGGLERDWVERLKSQKCREYLPLDLRFTVLLMVSFFWLLWEPILGLS